jgi:hypothetical protein
MLGHVSASTRLISACDARNTSLASCLVTGSFYDRARALAPRVTERLLQASCSRGHHTYVAIAKPSGSDIIASTSGR